MGPTSNDGSSEHRKYEAAVQDLLASTQRVSAAFTEQLGQQLSVSMKQFASSILDTFVRRVLQSFAPSIQVILEAKKIEKAFRAGEMLAAPSMSLKLVESVVRLHEEGKDEEIAKVITEYYEASRWRRLRNMIAQWELNGSFGDRIHVLKEALYCHCRGWFGASVPTLLLQVEGVSSDYVESNESDAKPGKTRAVVRSALSSSPMRFNYTYVAALLGALDFVNGLYRRIDFGNVYEEARIDTQLLGHAVRHGINIGYASETNSLTLFILLDTLSELGTWMYNTLEEKNNL